MKATLRPVNRCVVSASGVKQKGGGVMCARVVEQDVQLGLAAEELYRSFLDGCQVREVNLKEDGFSAGLILQRHDCSGRLLSAPRRDVDFRVAV